MKHTEICFGQVLLDDPVPEPDPTSADTNTALKVSISTKPPFLL